jgi:hypothetical protein
MKTEYKSVRFEPIKNDKGGALWECFCLPGNEWLLDVVNLMYNTHKEKPYIMKIGVLSYDTSRKIYTFCPNNFISLTVNCLADIIDFMRQLDEQQTSNEVKVAD